LFAFLFTFLYSWILFCFVAKMFWQVTP